VILFASPSSGFATFSPRKKRGGRRRSMGDCGDGVEVLNVQAAGLADRLHLALTPNPGLVERPDEGRAEKFELQNLNFALTPNRAPSPHRFSDGEKVAEGRMRGRTPAHLIVSGTSSSASEIQSANPPSSGFATFSPRKKRGGRRRSMGGLGDGLVEFPELDLAGTLNHIALTPNRAPSPHRFSDGEKVAEGRMRGPIESKDPKVSA
jgi:hypothetical protein